MTDERDKKRAMIVEGTGNDSHGNTLLKQGDDIPKSVSTAGPAVKVLDSAGKAPITLESMASYIRSLTSEGQAQNSYPVSELQATLSLKDTDGSPAQFITPSDGVFASAALLEALGVIGATFDDETLTKLRDPKTGFHEVLRHIVGNPQGKLQKSGGQSANVGNHHAEIATPPDAPEIQKKISEVLKRNRFNPNPGNTPYAVSPSATTIDKRPMGKLQTNLGGYDNVSVDGTTGITYEEMKKVGLALMLRATGIITKDGSPLGNPDRIATEAGGLLPGYAQLLASQVVDPRSMLAKNLTSIQGIPPGFDQKPHLDSELILDNGRNSYGNLNSYIAQFDGFAPITMIALGVALVLVVKLLIEGFLLGLNGLVGVNINATGLPSTTAIHPLGASRGKTQMAGGLISLQDLGIHEVRHDYLTSVNRGIDVFFQLDSFGDYVRVIKSPGYYAVLVRAIIRSGGEVVKAFGDIFSNLTNPITALQALSGLIDVIKTSTLIGFINMLAGLGDTVLYLEDNGFLSTGALGALGDPAEGTPDGRISYIDRLADNAITHVRKSRAKSMVPGLSWRTSSTPSLYLLPPSATGAASSFTQDKSTLEGVGNIADARIISEQGVSIDTSVINATGRIKGDDVKRIEDHLESEYVPFYFHDLRTNEIVSFHAFLSAIDESFNANYVKDTYFGRVDPVLGYTGTDRSINLSFHVIATSHADFDVMWWKINKLITMLYPQWSRGRKVEAGQDAFIQPFSQVMTSSPVIRLRLGDLYRSNYSKFGLARLFGIGTEDFKLDGTAGTMAAERAEKINAEAKKIRDKMMTDPVGSAKPEDDGYHEGDKAALKVNEKRAAPLPILGFSNKKKIQNTNEPLVCTINSRGKSTNPSTKIQVEIYTVVFDSPPEGVYAGPYIVEHNDLMPDEEFILSRALDKLGLTDSPTAEQRAVESFFSADNNVIVRSFESTRGRGLAGVITNVSFDWKTPSWEINLGSKAPQHCIVKMTFQPIHDIAPGIDADGFNRAPVYNVGHIVNEVASDPYGDTKTAREIHKKNADAVERLFKSDDIIG